MRKFLTLTAAAAFALAVGFAGPAQAGLTDDLVGYWSFDASNGGLDATDDSTTGNDGTVGGDADADCINTPPTPGNACSATFDAVDDFVSVDDDASLEPQNVTLAAWVNADTAGAITDARGAVIVSKDLSTTETPPSGGVSYALFGPGNTGKFTASVDMSDFTRAEVISTNTFAFDVFHHVAMTWDGSELKLYVNGTLEGTHNVGAKTILYGTSPVNIGRHPFFLTREFDGLIDEVRIYDVALTADQIAALHNPQLCAETVAAPDSIQDAVDANAGFVVCLSEFGVFSQSVVFGPEDSGTTLRNVDGESPVMDGTGPADAGTSILADGIQLLDDVSDVTIKGLEITNYKSTDRSSAIQAWDVDTTSINVRNNFMHALTWNGVLVGSEGGFLHDSWMVKDNRVEDFGFVGIELTNCNSCSILKNTVDAGDGLIAIAVQARSTSTTGTGIHDVAIDGVSVLHNSALNAPFAGIYVLSFIGHPENFSPITGKSVLLTSVSANNNTVTDNDVVGIRFWAFNDDATLRNGRIQHNVITCDAADSRVDGVQVLVSGDDQTGTVRNVKVVRNSFPGECDNDIVNRGEATKLPPGGPFP